MCHLLFEASDNLSQTTKTPSPCRVISLKSARSPRSPVSRTVPSFRMAAEIERTKWRQFRSYLDKKDRKEFDQMYDYFELNSAACSNACRPVVIHAVLMSIIFEHYKQLTTLVEQQNINDKKRTSGTLDLWT
jgi:hypothetical protein